MSTESTVSQKLDALMALQKIDSQIDELLKIRGDLPEEVRDLEDELAGYETRIGKFKAEIEELNQEVLKGKAGMKEAEKLIKKYQDQQNNVRNNREFEAISKEMESQELDIQLFEKKNRETLFRIEKKNIEIADIEARMLGRKSDLEAKKSELDSIVAESTEEEKRLRVGRETAESKIEERLMYSYNRIRQNSINGLAVVKVRRGACGGCFNQVPPQRQADIRERKKIIVCEHCGRVLADVEVLTDETVAAPLLKGKA
jgi:predicted  nucleic acid-binding Zn-ribbon protein